MALRPPGRRLHLLVIVGSLVIGAWLASAPAQAQSSVSDDRLVISGEVTDSQGAPLADVQVILEAEHRSFDFRTLGRVSRDETRRTTRTDKSGKYHLRWFWNPYFNHVELLVGMTVRVPDGEQFYTLDRRPLSDLIEGGGSLDIDIVVEDVTFLRRFRAFVSGLRTADERRVYERMGIPAKVDRMKLSTHEEVTWWYFEAGKAYRFRSGRLVETSDFEPVAPFGEESEKQE